ncbi:MAG: alpha/beta fold hydrolase [Thermoanaerobaculia bacterium]
MYVHNRELASTLRKLLGAALIFVSFGVTACSGASEERAAFGPAAIGSALDPDGSVAEDRQGDRFSAGEPIYVAIAAGNVPAGRSVRIAWYGPREKALAEQEKAVEAGGSPYLFFKAPDTAAWEAGVYRAEVLAGGKEIAEFSFNVVAPERIEDPNRKEEEFVRRTVFYGTDRAETSPGGPEDPERYFGGGRARSGTLRLGTCEVSIPRDHRMGQVERPSIWKLEFRADPSKHMVLLGLTPMPPNVFFGRLRSAVQKSEGKEALVFIHGFDVSFTDAVLRTAQVAYDLGFDGAPITYSWPSQASLSKTAYHADETNAEWTAPHLEKFLSEVAARSGAREIHLIAHSMGNRPLTAALQRIGARMTGSSKPLFGHIVLTAPDIDADTFRQIASEFSKPGKRTTLYASSRDKALQFSREIHGGLPRAGDSGPDIVVLRNFDTIEVSAVDTSFLGHSYYGDNRSVLSDLFGLIRDGRAPDKRFGLRPRTKRGLKYWVFQPS